MTRERFLDHEDFLYSLQFGTQFRKLGFISLSLNSKNLFRILNLCIPDSFDLSSLVPSSPISILRRATANPSAGFSTEFSQYIDDDVSCLEFDKQSDRLAD